MIKFSLTYFGLFLFLVIENKNHLRLSSSTMKREIYPIKEAFYSQGQGRNVEIECEEKVFHEIEISQE